MDGSDRIPVRLGSGSPSRPARRDRGEMPSAALDHSSPIRWSSPSGLVQFGSSDLSRANSSGLSRTSSAQSAGGSLRQFVRTSSAESAGGSLGQFAPVLANPDSSQGVSQNGIERKPSASSTVNLEAALVPTNRSPRKAISVLPSLVRSPLEQNAPANIRTLQFSAPPATSQTADAPPARSGSGDASSSTAAPDVDGLGNMMC
jgi:hypothetical protein